MSATRALLDEGHAALHKGDGPGARRAFEEALAEGEPESAELLEALGDAAYLELDLPTATSFLERAYAAFRAAGRGTEAVRAARQVAYFHGISGNGAVMQGWNARAQALMDETGETSEAGWIRLTRGMWEADRTVKEQLFVEALEIARRYEDADLRFTTQAYYGASLVHGGRTEEGMLRLDEACAAVVGREVSAFPLLEEIFCQMFSACEHAHDIVRADQWIRVADELVAERNLPAVSAFCRTHYGGLLTAAGRWSEADSTLVEAVRIWGLGYGALRFGALIRLADLRVRQGRLEEAAQLLDGMDVNAETARPIAALQLARGDRTLAAETLERVLSQVDRTGVAAAPLFGLLVDVHLAGAETDLAAEATEQLIAIAERHPSHYLQALAALASGRVCLATGTGDARACLRDALAGFARAQMPVELATVRLQLAESIAADQPDVALAEATAALEAFEQLRAARLVDAASATLRALGGPARTGPKGDRSALTRRESEVLDLLGLGLSNPQIAERLFISRKTVEHHVGNLLVKLGLRSRTEAAAYAARAGKDPERI